MRDVCEAWSSGDHDREDHVIARIGIRAIFNRSSRTVTALGTQDALGASSNEPSP
jgi:hypothetical protein